MCAQQQKSALKHGLKPTDRPKGKIEHTLIIAHTETDFKKIFWFSCYSACRDCLWRSADNHIIIMNRLQGWSLIF